MAHFEQTDAGAAWMATGDARETSPEIMAAIAFFARDEAEADALWNGDGFGRIANPSDIWEYVTNNGQRDATDYCWGAAGTNWWDAIRYPVSA